MATTREREKLNCECGVMKSMHRRTGPAYPFCEYVAPGEDDLTDAYRKLGETARSLLVDMSNRLVEGTHLGDFAEGRDYDRDALEEAIDLAHYTTKRNQQLQREIDQLRDSLAHRNRTIERMVESAAAARTAAQ